MRNYEEAVCLRILVVVMVIVLGMSEGWGDCDESGKKQLGLEWVDVCCVIFLSGEVKCLKQCWVLFYVFSFGGF